MARVGAEPFIKVGHRLDSVGKRETSSWTWGRLVTRWLWGSLMGMSGRQLTKSLTIPEGTLQET